MEPMVSIIMSVFNTEQYLKKCIDSLINQTFKEFELIIINNGSTDNSLKILEDYSKKDNRIKLISNSKNLFLSQARNQALEISRGKYVYVVDSDDFIENDTLEKTVFIAEKYGLDLVVFGWYMEYVINNNLYCLPVTPKENIFLTAKEFRETAFCYLNQSILTVPWNKLYLRSKIEMFKVRYRQTKLEDHHFNMDFIKNISRVAFLKTPFYHYNRSRNGSELNYIYKFDLFNKKKEHYLHSLDVLNYWKLNYGNNRRLLDTFFAERVIQCIQEIVSNEMYDKKTKNEKILEIIEDCTVNEAVKNAKSQSKLMKIMLIPLKLHSKFLLYKEAKFIGWYKKTNAINYIKIRAKNVNKVEI